MAHYLFYKIRYAFDCHQPAISTSKLLQNTVTRFVTTPDLWRPYTIPYRSLFVNSLALCAMGSEYVNLDHCLQPGST